MTCQVEGIQIDETRVSLKWLHFKPFRSSERGKASLYICVVRVMFWNGEGIGP